MRTLFVLITVISLSVILNVTGFAQLGGFPTPPPPPEIAITEVVPVGTDEVITIENPTRFPMDFTGWSITLTRISSHTVSTYNFPDGCFVPSGGTVRVHSGPANVNLEDSACNEAEIDLIWSTTFALPNDAFSLELLNQAGEEVSSFDYPLPLLPSVFINEMEITPASSPEWIELYNSESEDLDLTGWTLDVVRGTSVKLSLPVDQVIPAGGYLIISIGIEFLNDAGEIVELRDAQGNLVDTTPVTGLPDGLNDDRCWARAQDGANAWAFQACTQAAKNS